MTVERPTETPPVFAERPTARIAPDGLRFGGALLGAAALCALADLALLAWVGLALAGFVAFFFRNPRREIAAGEASVVAPADGRVVEAGEVELPDGSKAMRVGIFLSIFNVHVNRCPVAGRVVAIERGGDAFLAAFDRRAAEKNVRLSMTLETAGGIAVRVVQITGLIARRIVCHPRVGDWIRRGDRYGLIRFGSRTDVVLPHDAELRVRRGERVRGGRSVVAVLRPEAVAPRRAAA
ncbi:MAG: phosphatidylserine decarboxylase family protein [Deltaproteobacteria bacterium]|nr:MAG: phosphatidylserine decarboxylase family protein [Deltaproteobacteria bacterium]